VWAGIGAISVWACGLRALQPSEASAAVGVAQVSMGGGYQGLCTCACVCVCAKEGHTEGTHSRGEDLVEQVLVPQGRAAVAAHVGVEGPDVPVRVRVCLRACVRACVCVCACMCACAGVGAALVQEEE
jgi:hypothetical protein